MTLRLLGGLAIFFTCPSAQKGALTRTYGDIDLAGRAKETGRVKKLFAELGYSPREKFNAMQGGRRLIFNDLTNMRRVDIFLDIFQMSHKLDLRDRLTIKDQTLPLSDLLATKLQIVQMNDKDYRDILSLLVDHQIGESDQRDEIDGSRVARLCGDDWGIYKTFTINLGTLLSKLNDYNLEPAERGVAEKRAQKLLEDIEAAPKSLKWKLRARVGERAAWYETPEPDAAVVDSRF